jgi:hypothetical protein
LARLEEEIARLSAAEAAREEIGPLGPRIRTIEDTVLRMSGSMEAFFSRIQIGEGARVLPDSHRIGAPPNAPIAGPSDAPADPDHEGSDMQVSDQELHSGVPTTEAATTPSEQEDFRMVQVPSEPSGASAASEASAASAASEAADPSEAAASPGPAPLDVLP